MSLETELTQDEVANCLSSFPKNRNMIRYHRNSNKPMNPKKREEIKLEGSWTKTMSGDNFILSNDGEGKLQSFYKLIIELF